MPFIQRGQRQIRILAELNKEIKAILHPFNIKDITAQSSENNVCFQHRKTFRYFLLILKTQFISVYQNEPHTQNSTHKKNEEDQNSESLYDHPEKSKVSSDCTMELLSMSFSHYSWSPMKFQKIQLIQSIVSQYLKPLLNKY